MRLRLSLLFLLYLVQGLPFGFQAKALPSYLREGGHSLTVITLITALSLPWMLKALWAPWVDRDNGRGRGRNGNNGRGSGLGMGFGMCARFGKRRGWILPMQLCLAVACGAAAFVHPDDHLGLLLVLVLIMNLATATMDIAVDGLCVDSLAPEQLGYGNIAQVVGYKAGMILSGGVLLAYSDVLGWSGMFAIMTALVLAGMVATLLFRESALGAAPGRALETAGSVYRTVLEVLRTRSARALLIIIVTYKLGEAMSDALFVPFLVDSGFSRQDIGEWLGTYGMVASVIGSVAGGVMAGRMSFMHAVAITAALRVLPIAGQLWLTLVDAPSGDAVIAITVSEHFFGGALTTAMFALMMSRVDRRIGAMHYTVLATVEVMGKSAVGMAAGPLADASHSYAVVYGLALALSVAFLALLVPLARRVVTLLPTTE